MKNNDDLGAILEWVNGLDAARKVRVLDVRVGAFWSVVRTTEGVGMASSHFPGFHAGSVIPVADAGSLGGGSALELARLCLSQSVIETSIGVATLNSLLTSRLGETTSDNARDLLVQYGAGRRIAMIGRFPFVDQLRSVCDELWVFEQDQRKADEYSERDLAEMLPKADVVAVSATTLINHTLPSILKWTRPEAFRMMLGPSTPLCPVLFDAGFNVLCGTVVEEPEMVIRVVSQGAVTQQIKGVRRVCLWA
ncbi:MAG: DUF364 domain-containing protein [Thermoanaerobaculales bacterium]|nr:DUF364 domain-containing protein [Thermoanaerobaculales bacterium]